MHRGPLYPSLAVAKTGGVASAPRPTLNWSCMTSRRWSRTWRGWTFMRVHHSHSQTGGPWCAGACPGGTSRSRTPAARSRFLGWLLWQQLPVLVLSSLISVVEWLPGSVGPYIVGKIVDDGNHAARPGDSRAAQLDHVRPRDHRDHRQRAGSHPCGSDLAGRHVRLDEAGHPQGDPDGPRASAAYADRRGAQCLRG